MLRINLLPTYVNQRRQVRLMSVLFVVLFAVLTAGSLALYFAKHSIQRDLEAKATDAETKQKATQGLRALATSTLAQVAPIQANLDFVKAVHDYARQWASLYATLAQYTDPRMIYTDAAVSGTTMAIKAYTPSISEVGRYMQAIYKEPDFTSVGIDKLPGYPDNVISQVYLDGRLIGIIDQTGNGQGGSGGSSSYGGGGGQTSSATSRYGTAQVGDSGQNGSSGGSSSYGGSSSSSSYGSSSGSSSGYPGSSSGSSSGGFGSSSSAYGSSGGQGGGASPTAGLLASEANLPSGAALDTSMVDAAIARQITPFTPPDRQQTIVQDTVRSYARRIRVVPAPKGFGLNVTAVLKKALTPPALPGSPAAPTGLGGYPGGSPGGYPGSRPGGA